MLKFLRRCMAMALVATLLLGVAPTFVYADETVDYNNDKEWVIVLDPGHGGIDGGASRTINGVTYIERDLALKIALYCKQELEKYENVTVYLTRYDNTSSNPDRQQRAFFAASVEADVLVSLHLNATGDTTTYSATGAEVYYPNGNYASDISNAGWDMSTHILGQLSALGIYNNGVKIRNSEDGNKYPDGSLADYLGINYWAKLYGYVGILVEHAYINNPNDVANFLSTEAWLQAIGVADARGIMNSLKSGNFTYVKGMAGEWRQNAIGWWYEYAIGGYPANEWETIRGARYWFDTNGYMATGWKQIENVWYYFGLANDGRVRTGWQYIGNNWYYMSEKGEMQTGLQNIDGRMYYLGGTNDGAMKTGWQEVNATWYYFNSANGGAMQTGWVSTGNTWYYMGADGSMMSGLQIIDGKTYYFGGANDGAMKTGWQELNGAWYYFGEAGDGAMKTGWQFVDGYWYYMYEDGTMAANTWIDGYYVNTSGAWIN